MEQKNYIVTGGTGFAAAHLINLLIKEGHNVTALTRRTNGMYTDVLDVIPQENFDKINWVVGDLTDRNSLLKIFEQPFDGCFHLAAMSLPPQSFVDPLGTFNQNIIGTANLVDVIEKTQGLNCKLMFCSTSEVYGNSGKDGQLLAETNKMSPCNPYAVSKSCSELNILERIENGKINAFITRAFSHTGARRGKNFSISSDAYQIAGFILDYEKNKDDSKVYELRVGNLSTRRVVMSVEDTVLAYYQLMINEKSNGQIYNVCGEKAFAMEHFTDILIGISGVKNIVKKVDDSLYRKHDIFCQRGDSTKLKKLTKWEAKIPIEDTLTSLLEYWVTKLTNSN